MSEKTADPTTWQDSIYNALPAHDADIWGSVRSRFSEATQSLADSARNFYNKMQAPAPTAAPLAQYSTDQLADMRTGRVWDSILKGMLAAGGAGAGYAAVKGMGEQLNPQVLPSRKRNSIPRNAVVELPYVAKKAFEMPGAGEALQWLSENKLPLATGLGGLALGSALNSRPDHFRDFEPNEIMRTIYRNPDDSYDYDQHLEQQGHPDWFNDIDAAIQNAKGGPLELPASPAEMIRPKAKKPTKTAGAKRATDGVAPPVKLPALAANPAIPSIGNMPLGMPMSGGAKNPAGPMASTFGAGMKSAPNPMGGGAGGAAPALAPTPQTLKRSRVGSSIAVADPVYKFGETPKVATDLQPSAVGEFLTNATGLSQNSTPATSWFNPASATSISDMPWTYGAIPAAVGLGATAGYLPVNAMFNKLRKRDLKSQIADAKKRYELAIRQQALSKQGEEKVAVQEPTLDGLFDAIEKQANLSSLPIGLASALFTMSALGTGAATFNNGLKNRSSVALREALKRRQAEVLNSTPRPLLVQPTPIKPGKKEQPVLEMEDDGLGL